MSRIVISKVNKYYGDVHVLDGLDLVVEDGDFMTLLGPSGCGKTTTLRVIAGLESPRSGTLSIGGVKAADGEVMFNVPPAKRGVNLVFQSYALWPHMTVFDNVAFGLEIKKTPKARIREKVGAALERLHIGDFAGRYPSELSGGQQQRVAIARSIVSEPRVLLLDEPLSNLDAKLRIEMRSELKRLHQELKTTVVYVTHDQVEAMTLSTKTCLMRDGLLQQYAPPLQVYNRPSNVFVADFVGSPTINFIEGRGRNVNLDEIKVSVEGLDMIFAPVSEHYLAEDQEIILGIRPEYLKIGGSGPLKARVYSSLPSGMETIVRIRVGEQLMTSVVFGAIDFEVDEEVGLDFVEDRCIVFDRESGANLALGRLSIV